MEKKVKKGKNTGAIDSWLENIGYYRKTVAYDETCLFRAISEQVYSSQIYHERVRKEYVEYAAKRYEMFEAFVDDERKWAERLHNLKIHMAVCGNLEIQVVSQLYKRDVMIFDSSKQQVQNATNHNYPDTFLLCLIGEDHYDVVYKMEEIVTAGFCQSLAYTILYEHVFQIPNVAEIVTTMLHDKSSPMISNSNYFPKELTESTSCDDLEDDVCAGKKEAKKELPLNEYDLMLRTNITPFPFKVAKALDPNIYRNIAYDTWTETRKQLLLGDWYYGDNNLTLGTCCQLNSKSGPLQCYIQNLSKDKNMCEVYVTSLAEKRLVRYCDLSPEKDAKPWPLPYRFNKKTPFLPIKIEPNEKEKKSNRRKKDKNNNNNNKNDVNTAKVSPLFQNVEEQNTVNKIYKGCALQKQNFQEFYYEEPQHNTLESPVDDQVPRASFNEQWEQQQTSSGVIVWQQSPNNVQEEFPAAPRPMLGNNQVVQYSEPYNFNNVGPQYQAWNNEPEHVTNTIEPLVVPQSPQPDFRSSQFTFYPESYYLSPPIYPQPLTPVIFTPPDVQRYNHAMDLSYMSPVPCVYSPVPPISWYTPPPSINSQGFVFPGPISVPAVQRDEEGENAN